MFGHHPLWTGRGLGPAHDVVARAQRLAKSKVRDARSILLEQHIHALGHHRGDLGK